MAKTKTITEKLDRRSRTVGPLSVFGIREFWRVPTILPKALLDLTRPVVDFGALAAQQWVCLGGIARNCRMVDVRQESLVIEIEDDEGSQTRGDGEPSANAVEGARSTKSDEGEGDSTPLEVPRPVATWRFDLCDMSGRHSVAVEISSATRREAALIERAKAGHGVWLGGCLVTEAGLLVLKDAEVLDEVDLGEIHAFYPSKTRREELKPARGSKRGPRGPRWVVRKMSSATVGVLVRDKNRFAIARCAAAMRDRLHLRGSQDEWLLMKTLESPAPTLEATLKLAHAPMDVQSGASAGRALERIAALEVLQQIAVERRSRPPKATRISADPAAFKRAVDSVRINGGIEITMEQRLACAEILADLDGPLLTQRLLSGDVGTGKTVVLAVVAACVHAGGALTVILEPRSQLAEQVHANLVRFFPDIPLQLITGNSKDATTIERGIVVGTTGVWSRLAASGCAPGLIVADEQQKFGVGQRSPWEYAQANVLEATATAIPRTQALIEFGGMDVSMLRHCHSKKTIHTELLIGLEDSLRVYDDVIRRVRGEGKNLILVFPTIEWLGSDCRSEEAPPLAVEEAAELWEEHFPGEVSILHGGLDDAARSAALARFDSGMSKVLIGTSILEVGLDLRKADIMVIHHPERLGVSAVHQLRGRLARKGGEGWCYLACSAKLSESSIEMLRVLESETDGFRLALADMARRGAGDLRRYASQQSGDYDGLLVDRPPSIPNLAWVEENCRPWLAHDRGGESVFGDEVAVVNALIGALNGASTPAPRRRTKRPTLPAATAQKALFPEFESTQPATQ